MRSLSERPRGRERGHRSHRDRRRGEGDRAQDRQPKLAVDTHDPRAGEKRMPLLLDGAPHDRRDFDRDGAAPLLRAREPGDGVPPRGDPHRGALGTGTGDLRRDPQRARLRFLLRAADLLAHGERPRIPLHVRRDARRRRHHRATRRKPPLPGARGVPPRAAGAHPLRVRARSFHQAHHGAGDRDDRALHVAPVPRPCRGARAGRDRAPSFRPRGRG
jgi:hypothetical protein